MPTINFQVKSEMLSEQLLSKVRQTIPFPDVYKLKEKITIKRFGPEELAVEKHLGIHPMTYRKYDEKEKVLLFKEAWEKMEKDEKELFQIWQLEIPNILPNNLDKIIVQAIVENLQKMLDVYFVSFEKNYELGAKASAVPDNFYAIDLIECPAAWNTSEGEGIVVAVIDSGLHRKHKDIDTQIFRDRVTNSLVGRNVIASEDTENWADTLAPKGHGTHVAGIIAAERGNKLQNGDDVVGVAPKSKVIPVKAFDQHKISTSTNLAAAFLYAAYNPDVHIINNSWYYSSNNFGTPDDMALQKYIKYAVDHDIICVFAAGNDDKDISKYWVVDMDDVIVVSASDHKDLKVEDSNWSNEITIAAPGWSIYSLQSNTNNSYFKDTGTSMAAPHVSGAIALYLAAKGGNRIHAREIIKRLRDSDYSDPINFGGIATAGGFRLNCRKFLSQPL